MLKRKIFYWFSVGFILVFILITVRYIVNHTRIFVNYEIEIDPIVINWERESDSMVRIKDPIYVRNDFFLIEYPDDNQYIKEDSVLYEELFHGQKNKGSLLNLSTPYTLWKSRYNDTIHVYKNKRHLKFVYDYYTASK